MCKWLIRVIFLFIFFSPAVYAQTTTSAIQAIKAINCVGDYCELVFDLNKKASYKIFTLSTPSRFVIDFSNTKLLSRLQQGALGKTAIKDIRYAKKHSNILRIVLDMRSRFKISKYHYIKNPNNGYSLTIVLTSSARHQNSTATSPQDSEQPVAVIDNDSGIRKGVYLTAYVGLRVGNNRFNQNNNPFFIPLGGDNKQSVAVGGYLGYGFVFVDRIFLAAEFGAQYRGPEGRTFYNDTRDPGVTYQMLMSNTYGLSVDLLPGVLVTPRTLFFARVGAEFSRYRFIFIPRGMNAIKNAVGLRLGVGLVQMITARVAALFNYVYSSYPTINFIRPNRSELDAGLVVIF